MSLETYRVPPGVREGVDLQLPGTDSVFRVKLPSQANKPYQRALMVASAAAAAGDRPLEAGGGFTIPATALAGLLDAQQAAFGKHCLVPPLPDGITFETLRDEYPTALDWIYNEAQRLALELDEEANDATKKSLPSSPGPIAGRGKRISTDSLRDPDASPSATAIRPLAATAG